MFIVRDHGNHMKCPLLSAMLLFLPVAADAEQLQTSQSGAPVARAEDFHATEPIGALIGTGPGPTQWRLGLGGGDGAFSIGRYLDGRLLDRPLIIDGLTGQATFSGSNFSISDVGRSGGTDNAAALTINSVEAVRFPTHVTNYGLIVNRHQLVGGRGDRIAASFIQTCDAMEPGQSCVGGAPFAVAGGSGSGNYTGSNPRVLVPGGLRGGGNAVGQEINTETHSPINLKYGLLVADLNQAGPDNSTTHGKVLDTAIMIAVNPPPPVSGQNIVGFRCDTCGYKSGITFGAAAAGYTDTFPIVPGGTLLQASNPKIKLDFGLDLTGMAAGFNYGALALPVGSERNGIVWGYNRAGGTISSTATRSGPQIIFTDDGLVIKDAGGKKLLFGLSSDGLLKTTLYTPSSSKASCTKGQIADDESFHYVCVASNSWKRVALLEF